MTVRTFRQMGQGFGAEPVGIIAKINDIVVFEGTTPALDQPLPEQPTNVIEYTGVLFSWENTVDFEGSAEMEITVTGPGTLILTDTVANYVGFPGNNPPLGPDTYGSFYNYLESDTIVSDPFSNPTIDGVEIIRNRNFGTADQLTGQWWYILPAESTFTGTVNISAGTIPVAVEE
jgi:hypothetical protein